MPATNLTSTPTLSDLLQGYVDAPAIPISGIASDSRQLDKGFLFLACQGMTGHGLDYLGDAKEAGVSAVAFDSAALESPADTGVPMFAVDDLGDKLGEIANRYYGQPSMHLRVVGVTGTNGKTTVAWLIAQCTELLGTRCGYLGTLGYGVDEIEVGEGMTTPAAIELHTRLAGFIGCGAGDAAIEVSSHALSQGRVDGVRFEAALFTNLSRDHLDYHADMREYFESKAKLFLECDPRSRIINVDSDWGEELAERCPGNVVEVSTDTDRAASGMPFVFARSVLPTSMGSDISFTSSWGDGRFALPLPGDFNVANAIIVLALLLKQGVQLDRACDVLSRVCAPPGRMQRVADGAHVFVDYAHTPGAMEVALRALRTHCRGRLWCVFGCGGERDSGKRPLMGRIAEQLADRLVITSDNPRGEAPQTIIDEILAGVRRQDGATVIEDRAAAIAWAVRQASPEDVVLIAGKGHENYQEVHGQRLKHSDVAVARALVHADSREDAS